MNDFLHRLFSSTVFLMTCMFFSKGDAQDMTKALIWGTYTSDGLPQLKFFYGNPATYVPDLANGGYRGSYSSSYSSYAHTFNSGDYGFGGLDMRYSESLLSYSLDMQLFYSKQLIPRTGSEIYYTSIPVLSNVVPGVSIDWVSQLVYWSDASYQRICMLEITGYGSWRVVVDTNLTSPQDVVVYPQQSFLFWSDFGDKSVIERFDLKTDDRRILLSSPTLKRPTTLIVDFSSQRLFWLDAAAATIGSMNVDGSSPSFWTLSAFSSVSSFALFQNYVFLGRNDANAIDIYDRNQQYKASITQDGKGIVDMTVYSQERNPNVSSPCTTGIRGGCAHMCITVTSTQRRCMCAMGLFLDSDGVNCVTKPMQTDKFLILSDQNQANIYQINVDTGEVRALTISQKVWPPPQPTAIAFYPFRNYLYYFEKSTSIIQGTSFGRFDPAPLLNTTNALGSDITSLAFDSEDQILFYVDNTRQTISAMYLSNGSPITIYSNAGSRPRTIVLDTKNRLLYWSDCGYNTIERGSTTNLNTNRKVIVSGLSACAVTFAIDFQNQMIFWADDRGSIETVMLDGSARSVIFQDSKAGFAGLALDAQFIYISDTKYRQIRKIDRKTKQLSNLTKVLFVQPFALLYYSMDTASTASVSLSMPTSTTTSTDNNNGVTTIIVASVISGAVVLTAVIVTVGIVLAKRRRASRRKDKNSLADLVDASRANGTLHAVRRDNSNPQVFSNEYDYADLDYTPGQHSYVSIKYPPEDPTGRQTVAPPPYVGSNEYVRDD